MVPAREKVRRSKLYNLKKKIGRVVRAAAFSLMLPLVACNIADCRSRGNIDQTPRITVENQTKTPNPLQTRVSDHHEGRRMGNKLKIRYPEEPTKGGKLLGNLLASHFPKEHERILRINDEITKTWTETYLGEELFQRFSKNRPIAYFDSELLSGGIYFPKTNIIAVNHFRANRYWFSSCLSAIELLFSKNSNPQPIEIENVWNKCEVGPVSDATTRIMLIHEQFHYLSFLGNSGAMIWNGHEYDPFGNSRGFHEAVTEYLTQRRGFAQGSVARVESEVGTALIFYMSRVIQRSCKTGQCGDDMIKQAYFSGDFSEIETVVGLQLGDGAFELFSGISRFGIRFSFETLCEIKFVLEDNGFDYVQLARSDELMQRIGHQIIFPNLRRETLFLRCNPHWM